VEEGVVKIAFSGVTSRLRQQSGVYRSHQDCVYGVAAACFGAAGETPRQVQTSGGATAEETLGNTDLHTAPFCRFESAGWNFDGDFDAKQTHLGPRMSWYFASKSATSRPDPVNALSARLGRCRTWVLASSCH